MVGLLVVVVVVEPMRLDVDVVFHAFLIHRDDALFSLGVGVGNSESDVRNDL